MTNYFFYQGQNDSPGYPTSIRDILQTGNSAIPTSNFSPFPSYTQTNYTKTDLALPFSFKTNSGEIANVYKTQAAYRDFNTSTPPLSFEEYPVWTDRIHVVAIGGGGGKGGNGGCGYGNSRHPGGDGAPGAPGQYVAYTGNDLNVTGSFYVVIGGAGTNGSNGKTHPTVPAGSGGDGTDGGQGGSTYISFTGAVGANTFSSLTIGAIGGGGGGKGNGGNANNADAPTNNNVAVNNTYPNSINDSNLLLVNTGNGGPIPSGGTSSNNALSPPADYNPANYLNNAGKYQNPGFLRIYFLKS